VIAILWRYPGIMILALVVLWAALVALCFASFPGV
jgi:hypothetical protein